MTPIFFTKMQGRFVQCSYLLQTNSNRGCFDFLWFQHSVCEEGLNPTFDQTTVIFLLQVWFKLVIRFLHDKSSLTFGDPLGFGLRKHTRHHTSVWGNWWHAALPLEQRVLGLPRWNELKWTLEHVSVKAGPTFDCCGAPRLELVLNSSVWAAIAAALPSGFSLFRCYSWVDATPIRVRFTDWHVIQMDVLKLVGSWNMGWRFVD